ncbi:MAG: trypsin-like peptidase domain-containing protein [Planctomycetes bacterium]|nr:trypsin-like peptidase domain-containing protein [Planctomycetota bacterium]
MVAKRCWFFVFAFFVQLHGPASAEEMGKTIQDVQKYTALIPLCPKGNPDKTIRQGCGVVVKETVNGEAQYFVVTVYHLVAPVYSQSDAGLKPIVRDWNGKRLWPAKLLGKESIVYADKAADFAILRLPSALSHAPRSEGYKSPGLAVLKSVRNREQVRLGQEIYMLGFRPFAGTEYLYVLKKGIISSIIAKHPGFGNSEVYFVDKMPNKGMSGGPVFYSTGEGLGLIHGYVLEMGNKYKLSDDLTVVIPYSYILGKLREKLRQSTPRSLVK